MKNTKSLYGICIAVLALFDQYTKSLVVTNLKSGRVIPVWKGVFELRYLENRGAAFGMLQDRRIFFLAIGVIVLFCLFRMIKTLANDPRYTRFLLCLTLIGAGTIGNTLDRVRLGYVIDFFYFKWIDFPIFNVADIYITVGSILIVLFLIFFYNDEELETIGRSLKGNKHA